MTRLRRILATLADWLQPRCECPHGEDCPDCPHDADCPWSDAGVGT